MTAVPVLIFATILSTPHVQAQDRTPVGIPDCRSVSDTELHILGGTVVSLSSAAILFFVSRECEMTFTATVAIAGAAAVGAGIGKELIDRLGFGTPELRDIANTALGAVIGTVSMLFALTAFPTDVESNHQELRFTFLTMSVLLSLPVIACR